SNHAWQESTVTYTTRPPVDGPVVGTIGAVRTGQSVEVDITGAATGDGTYDLALVASSPDEALYRSRETTTPPKLVLTLTGNPPHARADPPAARHHHGTCRRLRGPGRDGGDPRRDGGRRLRPRSGGPVDVEPGRRARGRCDRQCRAHRGRAHSHCGGDRFRRRDQQCRSDAHGHAHA